MPRKSSRKFPGKLPQNLYNKNPRHISAEGPGQQKSVPNMTGRPGCWTMEVIRGSSVSYLACTPCVPFFVLCLIGVEAEGLLDYQGRAGSFPLYGGTFARSYSVSKKVSKIIFKTFFDNFARHQASGPFRGGL